jgi:curved DNA-binding protein CbpA
MNTSDAYDVLQLSPNAHPVMVTRAFRLLAAMYHPDNENTGDRDKFERIVEAYRLLSDPVRRAAHDQERTRPAQGREDGSGGAADRGGAKPESERRLRLLILTALYNTRRNSLVKPGVSLWVLAELTDSSVDDVQFSLWYLRGKKLIESDGDDGVAITVGGVDYVEAQEGLMADLLSLPERSEVRRPDELSS